MTTEQRDWFIQGHSWTLCLLHAVGVDVPLERLVDGLSQLREGTLTTLDTPEETVGSVLRLVDVLDGTKRELVAQCRASLASRRRVVAQRDGELASTLLRYYEGLVPETAGRVSTRR